MEFPANNSPIVNNWPILRERPLPVVPQPLGSTAQSAGVTFKN